MKDLFVREEVAQYILPRAIEIAKEKRKLKQFSATVFCLFTTLFAKRRILPTASAVVVDYKIRSTSGQKVQDLFPFSEKYGKLPEELERLPVLASITDSRSHSFRIGREAVLSRPVQFRLVFYVFEYLARNIVRGNLAEALSFIFDYYKALWMLEYIRSGNPPLTFLFTPTSLSSRPSWSQISSEKSSSVFCFYSSNMVAFTDGIFSIPQFWRENEWENVLFPDETIKDALVAFGWGKNFHCTPGLLFEKSAVRKRARSTLIELREPSVLFFDVEPFPDSYYENGTFDFHFYKEQYMTQILESICRTVSEKGWHIYIKAKRKRKSETQSEKYTNCIRKWENNGCLTTLSPDTPIEHIANKVNFCVATPFTSAAVISSDLGCPSIYYATQEIDRLFGGLHNYRDLELVIGETELVKFMSLNE